MDLAFLKRLIETVESSDIDTLEISRWATKIRISKSPNAVFGGGALGPATYHVKAGPNAEAPLPTPAAEQQNPASPAAAAPAETTTYHEVTSPMVGTFYRAPAPDADPYVDIGDRVRVGQTLCILEAMKLMNELEAEVSGTIRQIVVENAEPVEYGQVLFRIQPD
ncbi:MAG: acetyl-CoA carboxylase biotin carboxyl carrier protein [Gemmatimonadota bacterium]|nr:MAG: acetyl-CoA carboxylase biotin carboxyl carrier protein [Gemmatimonadota bacterium]